MLPWQMNNTLIIVIVCSFLPGNAQYPGLPSSSLIAIGFGFLPAIGTPSFHKFLHKKSPEGLLPQGLLFIQCDALLYVLQISIS